MDETSDMTGGELQTLLKRVEIHESNNSENLDLSQLEKFFRVCAGALAARQRDASCSRATTFAASIDNQLQSGDPEKIEQADLKQVVPLRPREQARPKLEKLVKVGESDAQRILDEHRRHWADKQKWWGPVLATITDVWQFQFPDCGHHGIAKASTAHQTRCHPLCDPVVRRRAQEEIVLARLCLEHDSHNIKDARRFMPWLCLLGAKLAQLHTLSPKFAWTFTDRSSESMWRSAAGEPFIENQERPKKSERSSLLTTILRYFWEGPSDYLARHDEFRLNDLLDFCYTRDVLPRPESIDDSVLEENYRGLVYGLWCLNIIQTPRYQLTFTYPWNAAEQRLPIFGFYLLGLSPASALMETLEGIERHLAEAPPILAMASGENVRCRDLNIQALRKIGGLSITWSMCDRDHLFLDQENGILRLSFSSRALVPEFYKYMPMLGRNDLKHTWELLLGHRKHQYDFAELNKIALPPELKALSHFLKAKFGWTRLRKKDDRGSGTSASDIYDIYDKYESLPNLPRSVPYSYFGRYEERVRILRHYMDTRKPTGFVNLWHDRRDSLTYYTFWAVLIFGGVSVILAVLGLVVGILQAYASFRALDQ